MLDALLAQLTSGNSPYMIALGLALTILAQRFGVKLPFAPPLAPLVPAPSNPAPAPAAPLLVPGQPGGLLSSLLPLLSQLSLPDLIRVKRAAHAHLEDIRDAMTPEPSVPVFAPPPAAPPRPV